MPSKSKKNPQLELEAAQKYKNAFQKQIPQPL